MRYDVTEFQRHSKGKIMCFQIKIISPFAVRVSQRESDRRASAIFQIKVVYDGLHESISLSRSGKFAGSFTSFFGAVDFAAGAFAPLAPK